MNENIICAKTQDNLTVAFPLGGLLGFKLSNNCLKKCVRGAHMYARPNEHKQLFKQILHLYYLSNLFAIS